MDTDNSGTITFEELKAGLPKLGSKLSESEVRQLMEAVRLLFSSLVVPLPTCFFQKICSPLVDTYRDCLKFA